MTLSATMEDLTAKGSEKKGWKQITREAVSLSDYVSGMFFLKTVL